MKKIRLDLETLAVESFSVVEEPVSMAGTVAAHADTEAGVESCDHTCPYTCPFSCPDINSRCVCYPVETHTCPGGPSDVYTCLASCNCWHSNETACP
ncbi:MAG TPA: hypothetical protein VFQ45_04590 [Longimicrobium sp.]|nr:hypothetical protein [Longimicrobium sp.]